MKKIVLILAAALPLSSCATLSSLASAALDRPLSFTVTIHY